MTTSRVATVTLHPALDQTVQLAALKPGTVHQAERMQFDAGGKGVNVAAFLADHGTPVSATGLLGEEDAGRFTALFEAKGIEEASKLSHVGPHLGAPDAVRTLEAQVEVREFRG